MDLDGTVTAAASLTIRNVSTEVDVAQGVNLVALNGDLLANTGVTLIDLSGAAGINQVTSTGGSINLADVSDSGAPAELEIHADTDLTLASVDIANLLDVDLDDAGASVLTAAEPVSAGTITVTGAGTDDTFNFADTVTSTTTGITIEQANLVDLDGTVTAAASLTIRNVNTEVDVAQGVSLVALNGDLLANAGVTLIDLSGAAGLNQVTSTNGSINLADLSDSGTPSELEIHADMDLTLASVDIANLLDVNLDDAGASVLTAAETLSAGTIEVTGDGTDDTLTFNDTVTSTGGGIVMDNVKLVNFEAGVTSATVLTVTVSGPSGTIDAEGQTLTATNALTLTAPRDTGVVKAHKLVGNPIAVTAHTHQYNSEMVANGGDATFTGTVLIVTADGLLIQNAGNVVFIGFDQMRVSGGNLNISQGVTGNITLPVASALTVAGDIILTTSSGDITLGSADTTGGVALSAVSGAISGGAITSGGSVSGTSGGGTSLGVISAGGATSLTSTGGNIDLASIDATGDLALSAASGAISGGAITSGGSVSGTSGGGTSLGVISAGGATSLTSTGGNIDLASIDTTGDVALSAASGAISGGAIDSGGSVSVIGSSAISLGDLGLGGEPPSPIAGTTTIESTGGDITSGAANSIGDLLFKAAGNITTGDITTGAANSIGDLLLEAGGKITTGALDSNGNITTITNAVFTLDGDHVGNKSTQDVVIDVGTFTTTGNTNLLGNALTLGGEFVVTNGLLGLDATNLTFKSGFLIRPGTKIRTKAGGVEGANAQEGAEVVLSAPKAEEQVTETDEDESDILAQLGIEVEETEEDAVPSNIVEAAASERATLGHLPTPLEVASALKELDKVLSNQELLTGMADQVEEDDDPETKFKALRKTDKWLKDGQTFLWLAKALLLQKGKNPKVAGRLFLVKYCKPLRTAFPMTYQQNQKMAAE